MSAAASRKGLLTLALFACAILISSASASRAANSTVASSTRDRSVALTIYADFAVVRDTRTLDLAAGINHVAFPGISPQMSPQTAFFTEVASDHPLWVKEQNFNANVVTTDNLLRAYVGRSVTVIETNDTTGKTVRENAVVLSADGPILKFSDRIETSVPPNGRIVFASIPDDLLVQPTFEADIGSTVAGSPRVALTYVAGGFSWSADYLLRLNGDVDRADLGALATVTNSSGADYPNATLALVSGDVQTQIVRSVTSDTYTLGEAARAAATPMPYAPPPQPMREALLEFYKYDVPYATTLLDKQTKQFTLFSAHDVPVHEEFEIDDDAGAYTNQMPDETTLQTQTYVDFTNKGPQLDSPLPSGTVHMYRADAGGRSDFVGDAAIDSTPRLAPVRLGLGQSYDITAKRVQTFYHHVSVQHLVPRPPIENASEPVITIANPYVPAITYYDDTSHRVTVSNAKTKPVTVKLIEQLPANWAITAQSAPYVKISSGELEWTLLVPASGSTVITYSVRVKE